MLSCFWRFCWHTINMLRMYAIALCLTKALAALNATENPSRLTISNDRLFASVQKSSGAIDQLTLDGQDLLGTRSGNTGIGPYLDCYCTPSGAYTPGRIAPVYKLLQGTDVSNTTWGGIVMSETYPPTGQILEQYWFLRDGETGLHTFSRLVYHNSTTPFLRNLQEFRTLFRPNTPLWTNLSTNAIQYAPLPRPNPAAGGVGEFTTVQDATWFLPNRSDPYVIQESDYFTKYTFSDIWRDHLVHGLFADGSKSQDGSTYGAWVVMNTRDTYFNGPKNSDLVVDGILYNYIVSNHHGNGTPNITDGFDRTFGPQYHHFNKGVAGTTLEDSRQDALQYAYPEWNADFYDSIAKHLPNYVPTSGRGSWKGNMKLPQGAQKPVAVLAQNKVDFQDNVLDTKAYQYWADIDATTGSVQIPRVKAGTYRLTVFANGVFGQFTQDNIVVRAGKTTSTKSRWKAESAGTELWRIGTPDRSSGEYRHGYARDPTHPLHPEEYRIYWAAYDYPTDFPEGVHFKVGESDTATDLNYVHWSVFGGYANSVRPEPYYGNGDVNNWTISFDTTKHDLQRKTKATFTVQLAGAKTAAGNTDVYNATEPYSNLPYTVCVNGHDLEPWVIP
jgi:rhamnogalacturonan endolyase